MRPTQARTPFYMCENFAPVDAETTETRLEVSGALPEALDGLFVRNGPNPRGGDPGHWFLGDGMLHGVRLAGGRAEWYRSRWVRTRYLEDPGAKLVSRTGRVDHTVAKANTHVIAHGGRLLALVESSFPTEVDAMLETRGVVDFDGALRAAFTAHPKRCPRTGELHAFGYGFRPPFLTYHVVDAAGRLVRSVPVALRRAAMMHDFALTERHVVFLDLPVVLDVSAALLGRRFPFAWSERHEARLGVLARGADPETVRWLTIPPCYVFHVLNAFESGDAIFLDAVRYESLWRDGPHDFPPARLHRWRIDLGSGTVGETPLDDRPVEFPRIDPRRESLDYRFGYAAETAPPGSGRLPTHIHRYDLERRETASCDLGTGRVPGEPVFVPAGTDAAEDEGWVLSYVFDAGRGASDLVILDAAALEAGPVATVHLPVRVPYGFHGSWVGQDEIDS